MPKRRPIRGLDRCPFSVPGLSGLTNFQVVGFYISSQFLQLLDRRRCMAQELGETRDECKLPGSNI